MSYRLFVSYSHEDSETAARLAEELMARGFRIWQDVHDIRLGKRIESEMEEGIASCGGVVHLLTEAALASTAVRREVALATQRRRRDPEFAVMSIARGIGQSHSEVGDRTLAEFGENFSRDWLELLADDSDPASNEEAAAFARLALRSFYPAGGGDDDGSWSIALHTRGAAPPGSDLDLDWRPMLGLGARNPGDYEGWARAWAAIREVRDTLAEHSGRREVELEAVAHQSAGILFGAAFCANGRWRLKVTGQDGAPWPPAGAGTVDEFRINRQPESLDGTYLTVEIELVRRILAAVGEHIATTGEEPRARLLVTRESTNGQIDPDAGGALAREIAGEIKGAVDDLGVDRVELYSAAPFPLSVLLAAQLGALHAEFAVFEFHEGYQLSIAIPEEER
jgi:TIR domain-containing protein/CBASS immunity sensor of nucleotide second messenger signals